MGPCCVRVTRPHVRGPWRKWALSVRQLCAGQSIQGGACCTLDLREAGTQPQFTEVGNRGAECGVWAQGHRAPTWWAGACAQLPSTVYPLVASCGPRGSVSAEARRVPGSPGGPQGGQEGPGEARRPLGRPGGSWGDQEAPRETRRSWGDQKVQRPWGERPHPERPGGSRGDQEAPGAAPSSIPAGLLEAQSQHRLENLPWRQAPERWGFMCVPTPGVSALTRLSASPYGGAWPQ